MVVNRQKRVCVPVRHLEEFLHRLRRELRLKSREITVCLMSDAAMARLNHTFRGQRGPTDVLSFSANGNPRGQEAAKQRGNISLRARQPKRRAAVENGYLGDIAISPRVARRNARRLGRPLAEELRVLILHGVLHLLGYDHETDHGEMEQLENRLRGRLNLRRG